MQTEYPCCMIGSKGHWAKLKSATFERSKFFFHAQHVKQSYKDIFKTLFNWIKEKEKKAVKHFRGIWEQYLPKLCFVLEGS